MCPRVFGSKAHAFSETRLRIVEKEQFFINHAQVAQGIDKVGLKADGILETLD